MTGPFHTKMLLTIYHCMLQELSLFVLSGSNSKLIKKQKIQEKQIKMCIKYFTTAYTIGLLGNDLRGKSILIPKPEKSETQNYTNISNY